MESEPSDLSVTQQLVVRAEQGQDLAFSEIYARHASRVRHSVASRLGGYDVPDLEDVVQETFLYAFEGLNRNVIVSSPLIRPNLFPWYGANHYDWGSAVLSPRSIQPCIYSRATPTPTGRRGRFWSCATTSKQR